MTAQEVLDAYTTYLWEQFQYDMYWLSNPWLFAIGNLIYLFWFAIKWQVLLAPATIPIITYRLGMPRRQQQKNLETYERN